MGQKDTGIGGPPLQYERPTVIVADRDDSMDAYDERILSDVADVKFVRNPQDLLKTLQKMGDSINKSVFVLTDPTGFVSGNTDWMQAHNDKEALSYIHTLDQLGVVTLLIGANKEAVDKALFSNRITSFCTDLKGQVVKELGKELALVMESSLNDNTPSVFQGAAKILKFPNDRRGGSSDQIHQARL